MPEATISTTSSQGAGSRSAASQVQQQVEDLSSKELLLTESSRDNPELTQGSSAPFSTATSRDLPPGICQQTQTRPEEIRPGISRIPASTPEPLGLPSPSTPGTHEAHDTTVPHRSARNPSTDRKWDSSVMNQRLPQNPLTGAGWPGAAAPAVLLLLLALLINLLGKVFGIISLLALLVGLLPLKGSTPLDRPFWNHPFLLLRDFSRSPGKRLGHQARRLRKLLVALSPFRRRHRYSHNKYLEGIPRLKKNLSASYLQRQEQGTLFTLALVKTLRRQKMRASQVHKLIRLWRSVTSLVQSVAAPPSPPETTPILIRGERPYVSTTVGNSSLPLLIDSGSHVSIISRPSLQGLETSHRYPRVGIGGLTLTDQSNNKIQTEDQAVLLPLLLEGNHTPIQVPFIIQEAGTSAANLLGANFLQGLKVQLNFLGDSARLSVGPTKVDSLHYLPDTSYDVYLAEDATLNPGINTVQATLQDPLGQANLSSLKCALGIFTPLPHLHEGRTPDPGETCSCATCTNQEAVHTILSCPVDRAPLYSTARATEGLVEITPKPFSIPLQFQEGRQSLALVAGVRLGIWTKSTDVGEDDCLIRNISPSPDVTSGGESQQQLLLHCPGGQAYCKAAPPNVNSYNLSLVIKDNQGTRCFLCDPATCQCLYSDTGKPDRVYLNEPKRLLTVTLSGAEQLPFMLSKLWNTVVARPVEHITVQATPASAPAVKALEDMLKLFMVQPVYNFHWYFPNLPEAGKADTPEKKEDQISSRIPPEDRPPPPHPPQENLSETTPEAGPGQEHTSITSSTPSPDPQPLYSQQTDANPLRFNQEYRHSHVGAPSELFEMQECIPLDPTDEDEEDIEHYIAKVPAEYRESFRAYVNDFRDTLSIRSTDIGKVTDPRYRFKVTLKDQESRSKLKPQTSFKAPNWANLACERILDFWHSKGYIVEARHYFHCCRLVLVNKRMSDQDLAKISRKVSRKTGRTIHLKKREDIFGIPLDLLDEEDLARAIRVCSDWRQLNDQTAPMVNVSQDARHCLDDLGAIFMNAHKAPDNATEATEPRNLIFSKIDYTGAHNSLVTDEETQDLLVSISPLGRTFSWCRASFGLSYVAMWWSVVLTKILYEDFIKTNKVLLYCDDLILCSKNPEEHAKDLRLLAEVCRREGLKISLRKSEFYRTRFEFLSFECSPEGFRLTDQKIRAIKEYQAPTNLKTLQSALGFFNYFSRHVPRYQELVLPMTRMLRKDTPFHWGSEEQKCFETLKATLAENIPLAFLDSTQPVHVWCDSSRLCGGSIVFQEDPKTGQEKVLFFHSRKYSKDQSRILSSLDLEAVILLDTLHKYSYFFNWSQSPIICHSDGKTLMYLMSATFQSNNARLSRFSARLLSLPIQFKIVYSPPSAARLKLADYLSRQYQAELPKSKMDYRKVRREHIQHNFRDGQIITAEDAADELQRFPITIPEDQVSELSQYLPTIPPLPAKMPEATNPDPEASPHQIPREVPQGSLAGSRKGSLRAQMVTGAFRYVTIERIVQHQSDDPKCREITDGLLRTTNHKDGRYQLLHHLLIRHKDLSKPFTPLNSIIVIPDSLAPIVIASVHQLTGHAGGTRMHKFLRNLYHVQRGKTLCDEMAAGCHPCQLNAIQKRKGSAVEFIPRALYPGHCYAIDHFFMPQRRGLKAALIVCDVYSGYCVAYPTKRVTAASVLEALRYAMSAIGVPKYLQSDNHKSLLRNTSVRKLLALFGVQKAILTIPHHPRHNALAERSIGLLREVFRALATEHRDRDWTSLIHLATTAANITPKKASGVSPFQKFFNREANTLLPSIPSLLSRLEGTDFLKANEQLIEAIKKTVLTTEHLQQKKYREKANNKAGTSNVKEGDLVLLQRLNPSAPGKPALKHLTRYHTIPYRVIARHGLLCIMEKVTNGSIRWAAESHVKFISPRSDLFAALPRAIQDQLGAPFDQKQLRTDREIDNLLELFRRPGSRINEAPVSITTLSSLDSRQPTTVPSQEGEQREKPTKQPEKPPLKSAPEPPLGIPPGSPSRQTSSHSSSSIPESGAIDSPENILPHKRVSRRPARYDAAAPAATQQPPKTKFKIPSLLRPMAKLLPKKKNPTISEAPSGSYNPNLNWTKSVSPANILPYKRVSRKPVRYDAATPAAKPQA